MELEPLDAIFPWRPSWSAQRFWARTDRSGECWLWTGSRNTNTLYGEVIVGGHRTGAHRIAYRLAVGPIPPGLQIDHLCRNRGCVRPSHLQAVTQAENGHRGNGWSGRNIRKTHCPQGHPYDETNTWRDKLGRRYCRTCVRDRKRAAYQPRRSHCEEDEAHWAVKLPSRQL